MTLGRPVERRLIFFSVCALGISSLMTQLTLMRELLCVFVGNELVFGIVLGNWLLLTGLGAFLGRDASALRWPAAVLATCQVLIAVLPLLQVFLVRVGQGFFLLEGLQVGALDAAVSSGVVLLPYCLVAGYLLTLACALLAQTEGASSIGRVYFIDNLGDIAGGVLFMVLVWAVSNHFHLLYLPAALNLIAAVLVAAVFRHRIALALAAVSAAGTLVLVSLVDLDRVSLAEQHTPARVVFQQQSPFGSVVVTELRGQLSFSENGAPLFSTHSPGRVEETVHFAAAQRPNARRVLLISGGVTGTAREVLKWPDVEVVDYVELDPLVVTAAMRFLPENLQDPRIHVITDDGRRYVQQTDQRYDLVIVDLADPHSAQVNRFYTVEFFREVARILTPTGVVACSLAHYANYVSEELAGLLGVAQRTLRAVFPHTRIIPGEQVYFLASNGPLDRDINTELARHRIDVTLLNPSYVDSLLADDRAGEVSRLLDQEAPVNRDFQPVLHYRQLVYWSSRFDTRLGMVGLVLGLLLLAYVIRSGPVAFVVFSGGCAASALEVAVLLGFQAIHGYVYQKVGLIVTSSIVGLAAGSFAMNRMLCRSRRRDLVRLGFALALIAGLVPVVLDATAGMTSPVGRAVSAHVIYPLLAFVPGVLVGMEFPLAGSVDFQRVDRTAARLYAADFIGAALGAIVIGAVLIPVVGLPVACAAVAGLNLASGGVVWATSRGLGGAPANG